MSPCLPLSLSHSLSFCSTLPATSRIICWANFTNRQKRSHRPRQFPTKLTNQATVDHKRWWWWRQQTVRRTGRQAGRQADRQTDGRTACLSCRHWLRDLSVPSPVEPGWRCMCIWINGECFIYSMHKKLHQEQHTTAIYPVVGIYNILHAFAVHSFSKLKLP